MFDVNEIEVLDTAEVVILNPKTKEPWLVEVEGQDKPQPLSVTVYGPGSMQFNAAKSASDNRMAARFRERGSADTTSEEDLEHKAEFLADITVSFNNFTYGGGDARARETFKACYADPKRGFITNPVNVQAGDWGKFIQLP